MRLETQAFSGFLFYTSPLYYFKFYFPKEKNSKENLLETVVKQVPCYYFLYYTAMALTGSFYQLLTAICECLV